MSNKTRVICGAFAVAIALACVAAPVAAQTTDDESFESAALKKKAYRFFSKGELLFDSGDYIKAAQAFLLAYETMPHPATLLNVAICYEKAGRAADAIEMYEKYLATSSSNDQAGRGEAEKRIAELSKQTGELVISCGMPDCKVRVDGQTRGETPITVKVSTGNHTVEALSRGVVVLSIDAAVRPGEATRVELSGMPQTGPNRPVATVTPSHTGDAPGQVAPSSTDPSEPADDGDHRHLRVPFWIASGATVAAGVVAIVFSARFKTDVDEHKKAKTADDEDEMAKWSAKGQDDQLRANIMWGVTGAAALTAIVLGFVDLWPRDKHASADEPTVSLNAGPGPGAGLGLQLSF